MASLAVVGAKYCISEHPMDLAIVRKSGGDLMVTDVTGNVMFKIQVHPSLHDRRILLDPAGNPIVTLRRKMRTLHGRWQVFMGDGHDKKDLLFSAKASSGTQFQMKMDVFLVNNKKEEHPDFIIEGNYTKISYIIYAGHGDGDSKAIIGQIHIEKEDNITVTVNPNVDCAFIATLVAIVENIHTTNEIMLQAATTSAITTAIILS